MISRLFRRKKQPPTETVEDAVPKASHTWMRHQRYGATALAPDDLMLIEREYRQYARAGAAASSPQITTLPGDLTRLEPSERGLLIHGTNGMIEVEWIAADCVRVYESVNADARAAQASGTQPILQPTTSPLSLDRAETDTTYRMVSGAVECMISKMDGALTMQLCDGVQAFVEMRPVTWRAGKSLIYSIKTMPEVLCAGFGGRVQAVNLRGERLHVYPTAESGVFAPVPFVMLISPSVSCGIYWRTSARMMVDARKAQAGELTIEGEDQRLDYFVMVGHSPVAVLARLASLFPPSPLPPIWGLGLHIGGEGLESADHVLRILREFNARGMPGSAVQLGSTVMDSGRPLTVNAQRFPDFSELVDQVHGLGAQVILEMHPAIHRDARYPLFTNGGSRGVFVSYADGNSVHGAVAGRMNVFPDFMRDDVRVWWSEQMRPLVRAGIDGVGVYNAGPDVDYPALGAALPDAALHHLVGEVVPHSSVRSGYAEQMAEACRQGLDKHRSALRPFVRLSGGSPDPSKQSFLTIETGKDWEGLLIALRSVLNANVSGFHLTGLEIEADNGEFLVRALQVGCLMPSLLFQTQQGGAGLPWGFGDEVEGFCRDGLHLRRRLLPYLYTCIALAREYGVPVLRPMWMQEPGNTAAYAIEDQFMIGDHLLVAPVLAPGVRERSVLLPEGLWYDYWTNLTLTGGTSHQVAAPLHRLPLFVRAGTVLNYATDASDAVGGQIRIYPGNSDSTAYDDPGEGFSYLHGDYRWVYYTCAWETNQCFVVNRRRTGGFFPSDKRMRIEVVGLNEAPDEVRLDRHGAPLWYFDERILEVAADDETGRIEVWLDGSPTSPTRRRRAL